VEAGLAGDPKAGTIGPGTIEQAPHQVAVTDIALNEDVRTLAPQRGQGIQITGVGSVYLD